MLIVLATLLQLVNIIFNVILRHHYNHCNLVPSDSLLYTVLQQGMHQLYNSNKSSFAFLSPPPHGGLGTTYDDQLRLIGKRIVDLLLVLKLLIELFR